MRFDEIDFDYYFSETEYENYDSSHAQVAKIEEQIQPPGEHSRCVNYYSTARGFTLISSVAIYTCIMLHFCLSIFERRNVG